MANKNTSKYYLYNDAREFMLSFSDIKTSRDFNEWSKANKRPAVIPVNPPRFFRKSGWISWPHFLNNKTASKRMIGNTYNRHSKKKGWTKNFLSYKDAQKYMSSTGLRSYTNFLSWKASGKRPANIPSNPSFYYKDKGWKDWAEFFGVEKSIKPIKGSSGKQQDEFCTYEEAKAYLVTIEFPKTYAGYCAWASSNKRPINIPPSPWSTYNGSGWKNMADFLGTTDVQPVETHLQVKSSSNFISTKTIKDMLLISQDRTLQRMLIGEMCPKAVLAEGKESYFNRKDMLSYLGIPDTNEKFLNVIEMGSLLGIKPNSLTALASEGKIPSYMISHGLRKFNGSKRLFLVSEIEKLNEFIISWDSSFMSNSIKLKLFSDVVRSVLDVFSFAVSDVELEVVKQVLVNNNTLKELGDKNGYTGERVRQMLKSALNKIHSEIRNGRIVDIAERKKYEDRLNYLEAELSKTKAINSYLETKVSNIPKAITMNIDESGLPYRSRHYLKAEGIHNIGQLIVMTDEQILNIYGLGQKSLYEINRLKDKLNTDSNSQSIIIDTAPITPTVPSILTQKENRKLKSIERMKVAINLMSHVIADKKNLKQASLDAGLHHGFLSSCITENINHTLPGTDRQKSMLSNMYLKYRQMVALKEINLLPGGGSQVKTPTRFPSVARRKVKLSEKSIPISVNIPEKPVISEAKILLLKDYINKLFPA